MTTPLEELKKELWEKVISTVEEEYAQRADWDSIAEKLFAAGKAEGREEISTYALNVLEDMREEGNSDLRAAIYKIEKETARTSKEIRCCKVCLGVEYTGAHEGKIGSLAVPYCKNVSCLCHKES